MRVILTLFAVAALATVTFAFRELSALREVAHPVPVARAVEPQVVVAAVAPPSPRDHQRELSTWRGPTPFGGVPGEEPDTSHPVVLDIDDVEPEEELVEDGPVKIIVDGERIIEVRSQLRIIQLESIIY
jgi:hypothetical protein